MAFLLTSQARAYVNHGRWIADCTRAYCNSAERLEPRQAAFYCTNCKQVASVEWPDDADEIWTALAKRPVPGTRNWFPSGHDLALRSGCPHGQTVTDLESENNEYGVS